MSKPRTNLTGPGLCVGCKEWVPDRVAKSMCSPCYQKMYYAFDSQAYAGRQEREYQKAARTLTNMLIEAKKLRECGILEPLEYVTMRKVIDDKLQQLRAMDNEEAEQIIVEEEIKNRVADADLDETQDA